MKKDAWIEKARQMLADSDESRDGSVISSIRRKHPSISREALYRAAYQTRETMRRRTVRPRRRTQGVATTTQLRDSIRQMLLSVRAQSSLTQVALAEKMGIPPTNISRMESGRSTPSIVTIDAFCTACGFELNLTVEKINASTSTSSSSAVSGPRGDVPR